MMDRVLTASMNALVIGLIVVTGGGSMFVGYWGLVELFNGHTWPGLTAMGASIIPAMMALKMAEHRHELVDQ